ncbi:hypothetical protein FG379_002394 [Cryptosporidium bovis]|uniref:uncharacterized protein n=1 Tax=Cryptosporidium bovis TaxID=310047 RepID=UPI00351A7082|nr:hypothetical protein FG379_002394 [Cryptosporidium bovis]
MDANDNPFFRKKPSTKVHHPPGGASSLGFGIGDFVCESKNKNEEEISSVNINNKDIDCDLTMETNDCKADSNIENREENVQVRTQKEHPGNDSSNYTNKNFKTNVKVHNPPGGKSSFSLC